MRITKDPEERRNEIMDVAEQLFSTKGYAKTTIMDILNEIGIAKGTFYYYFKSKEEILDAIIDRVIDADIIEAEKIIADPALSVFDKLFQFFMTQQPKRNQGKDKMMDQLHLPENAQMHQKTLVRSITRMAPLLTEIVKQGVREGVMDTPYPQESMEFLLVSGQTIFDKGLFQWPLEEEARRAQAFIKMMEAALGAKKGSFDYMAQVLLGEGGQ